MTVTTAGNGNRVSFAGVALNVPGGWRVLHRPPAFCGSVVGRTAYFSVGSNSPSLGCSSGPLAGPYLSVKCHPYPSFAPPPTGKESSVGSFTAIVSSDVPTSFGPNDTSIYLVGRDTEIDIYAVTTTVDQIESSISRVSGSC
jgi:hypothetical protein